MSTNVFCPVYDDESPLVPPSLIAHSRKMKPGIHQVTERVFLAYGYADANSILLVGDDGVVVVDTTEDEIKARSILAEFRKITDKPIKALIYTHFHPDHIGGARGFVDQRDVDGGEIQIISHETLPDFVSLTMAAGAAPILSLRNAYCFGAFLPVGAEGRINCGIGPDVVVRKASYLAPTRTFRESLDLTVAGVRMHLLWVPSECEDEIVVWLPDWKVLCSAEVVQGECYPNLYAIRGTRYRDPRRWYKSLDVLREFPAEYLAPSHGRPVFGRKAVSELLTAYRDGIQYVYDQTLRLMNRGHTPDELAGLVKLPPHLANHPWLGEFYGSIANHVREIYQGELGFFQGDPTSLRATPPSLAAARLVALMGGRETVLTAARQALDSGDPQWAAELATLTIRLNVLDMESRRLKARALREVGHSETAIQPRHWYMTAALELEGKLEKGAGDRNPDIAGLRPEVLLESLGPRLAAERTLDLHLVGAFEFTDVPATCGLEIRRGVAQFLPRRPERPNFAVRLDRGFLADLLLGKLDPERQLDGLALVEGREEDMRRFFSSFEVPDMTRVRLALR